MRRSISDLRRLGVRRPAALAAASVLALSMTHASAWASSVLTTVAGGAATGAAGFGGDGGPAAGAQLANPSGVAVDGTGNVFVADTANQRIRRIDAATGIITTVAGGAAKGAAGFGGDGGPAARAQLANPSGVAVDGTGNVFVADTANQRIRRIDAATGIITTVAGGAEFVAGAGQSAPPALVPAAPPEATAPPEAIRGPLGVTVDLTGAVLVANSPENRIDKMSPEPEPPASAGGAAAGAGHPKDPATLCREAEALGPAALTASPSWMTRTVSVSAKAATPDQELGLQGNGFGSGQRLTVTLCSVPTVLGAVTANPQGAYRTTVRIPANAAPGAHHLVLSDGSGDAAVALDVVLASRGDGTGINQPAAGTGDGTTDLGNTDLGNTDPGNADTGVTDPGSTDPGAGAFDPQTGDPIPSPSAGSTDPGTGADTGSTDSNGMPTTGADFVPMIALAGMSLKLGGALVLAGRRKSPAR
ncbi:MAG: hypothetical protein ACR2LJ_04840 [Acidimicrobiales bacterium]